MSTANTGDDGIAAEALGEARKALETHEEQLSLLEPVSPEETAMVRQELGPEASPMAVLQEARLRRAGRQKGARNKRSDDFRRWILSFGPHPAIGLMKFANSSPEALMENSKRVVRRLTKKGEIVEFVEMISYAEAMNLIIRAKDVLMPYLESKRPTAMDVSLVGVSDLIIAGMTHSEREVESLLEADFIEIEDEEAGE